MQLPLATAIPCHNRLSLQGIACGRFGRRRWLRGELGALRLWLLVFAMRRGGPLVCAAVFMSDEAAAFAADEAVA